MRELERDPSIAAPAAGADPGVLAIVGRGRVGGSIARAAADAGLRTRLARRDDLLEACRGADAVLICVPDGEIATVAAAIAEAEPPPRLVGHTSGATALDALSAAAARGAATYSLHPLQTVPDPETDLTAAPCAVSGSDEAAERFASALAERLGMRPFPVADEHRAAYHAAASMASNFLVALEHSAAGLLERAGVEDARELLAPLVLRSAANWAERGEGALTGPIARGDSDTVSRHLAALRERAPELVPLYEALAERTRELAARREGGS